MTGRQLSDSPFRPSSIVGLCTMINTCSVVLASLSQGAVVSHQTWIHPPHHHHTSNYFCVQTRTHFINSLSLVSPSKFHIVDACFAAPLGLVHQWIGPLLGACTIAAIHRCRCHRLVQSACRQGIIAVGAWQHLESAWPRKGFPPAGTMSSSSATRKASLPSPT